MASNKNQTNNQQIDLDTFYLTSFLLNYDIGPKVYSGDDIISITNRLLKLIVLNDKYPFELLMCKFFEYTIWKKINLSELHDILIRNLDLVNEGTEDFESQFKIYMGLINCREIIFNKFEHCIVYDKINELINLKLLKLNNAEEKEHVGQPNPDPELGRPRLEWHFCQYSNCKKKFSSANKLVEHLINVNAYTRGFHSCHENSVKLSGLTPDKVISENITVCPGYICENKKFAKPEDLIEHLQELGIEPFWQKGMGFNSKTNRKKLPDIKSNQMYLVDSCVICLDNPVQIFIAKCGHQVYCIDCLKRSSKNNCPICRCKVDMFLPYA